MSKFVRITAGLPYLIEETATVPAYSESIYYSSGLAANTNITLPNSGSFSSSSAKDLIVIVNDLVKESVRDFDIVGAGPTYTQIKFIYDLPNHSVVVFRKNI